MTSLAVLGLEVKSDSVDKGAKSLDKLTVSAKKAEGAANTLTSAQNATNSAVQSGTGAARQAAVATQAHTAASRANTMAQQAQAAAAKSLAYQQRMVAFQLNDVFVSLASGMNPMMVAVQQGSQLSQVQGGLAGAFRMTGQMMLGVITKFPLITAGLAATAVGFAGLTYEINKTTDVSVGLGDVIVASLQLAAEGIYSILQPAIASIAPYWGMAVQGVKAAGNAIIGAGVGAYKFIVAEWGNLPAAFGDIAYRAADSFLKGIDNMIHQTLTAMNSLMAEMGSSIRFDNRLMGLGVENPFAGAANKNGGAKAFADAMGVDYMGDAFDAVAQRAIKLAKESEKAGKKAKEASTYFLDAAASIQQATNQLLFDANSIGMPKDLATQFAKEQELVNAALKDGKTLTPQLTSEIERLARGYADAEKQMTMAEKAQKAFEDTMQFARDLAGGFMSDLRRGLEQGEGFWRSFGDAALNALDKIADKLLNDVLDAIFQVNNAGTGGGGILGGLFKMIGFGGGGGGFSPATMAGAGLGLYSSGGYTGNAPRNAATGIVHGQEYVVNAAATARFRPQLEAMNAGRAPANSNAPAASNQNVNINVNVDGANGDQHVIDLVNQGVSQGLATYDKKTAPNTARKAVKDGQRAGVI